LKFRKRRDNTRKKAVEKGGACEEIDAFRAEGGSGSAESVLCGKGKEGTGESKVLGGRGVAGVEKMQEG